jgi:hypothetical protein
MTTVVVERGSEWSESELHDGWGAVEGHEGELAELVTEKFRELAGEAGHSVVWYPSLSQVIGERDNEIEDGELDELRNLAMAEVWDAVTGFITEGEIADRVLSIFAVRSPVIVEGEIRDWLSRSEKGAVLDMTVSSGGITETGVEYGPMILSVIMLDEETIAWRVETDAHDDDWAMGTPEDAAMHFVSTQREAIDIERDEARLVALETEAYDD